MNPDAAGIHCIKIEAFHPGANNALTSAVAHVVDCETGETTEVEALETMVIIPRSISKAFAKGATLEAPQAQAFLYSGTYPQGAPTGTADTTVVGTDYKMVDKKTKKR